MKPNEYEKFQQQMFDQLDDLDRADQQSVQNEKMRLLLTEFVETGRRCGIDVVREIDKGASILDLVDRVHQREKELKGG